MGTTKVNVVNNIINDIIKKCIIKPNIIYTNDINNELVNLSKTFNQNLGRVNETTYGIHFWDFAYKKSTIIIKIDKDKTSEKLALFHEVIHLRDDEKFEELIDREYVVNEYGSDKYIFYNAQKLKSEYNAFSCEELLKLNLSQDKSDEQYIKEIDDINYEVRLLTNNIYEIAYSLIRYYSKLTEIDNYFGKKSKLVINDEIFNSIEEFVSHSKNCDSFDDYQGLAILLDKLYIRIKIRHEQNNIILL